MVGDGFRVALAQVGQYVLDVLREHRVGADEEHLTRVERSAVAVEQVCDALQQHAGLAAARDAGDQQCRHILVADDEVLLLLDGGGDGLHVFGALRGKRLQQQRVLDGDIGVEIRAKRFALDVELAAVEQVDFDGAAVGLVGSGTVFLVVVHLGNRAAPVDHHAAVVLVGNAGKADVDILGRGSGAHLQADFGEIRLFEQLRGCGQALAVGVLLKVVVADEVVEHGVVDVGLLGFAVAGEVVLDLALHVVLVLGGLPAASLHLFRQVFRYGLKLGVRVGQVVLLLLEDRVACLVGCGFVEVILHVFGHSCPPFTRNFGIPV